MRIGLERSQIRVEVGHGFDAAEIVFKSQMFVGGVGVFVRQAEAEQDARHLEGVVHLRYERDGTTLANENSLSPEALHQRGLCFLENGIVVGSHPRFSGAQDFKLAADRFRQERSEEHTSELQSPCNLVCRLLLE